MCACVYVCVRVRMHQIVYVCHKVYVCMYPSVCACVCFLCHLERVCVCVYACVHFRVCPYSKLKMFMFMLCAFMLRIEPRMFGLELRMLRLEPTRLRLELSMRRLEKPSVLRLEPKSYSLNSEFYGSNPECYGLNPEQLQLNCIKFCHLVHICNPIIFHCIGFALDPHYISFRGRMRPALMFELIDSNNRIISSGREWTISA